MSLAEKMRAYMEHIATLEDIGDDGVYGEENENGDLIIGVPGMFVVIPKKD